MIVRSAFAKDVPTIVALGGRMHAASERKDVEYDTLRVATFVMQSVVSDDAFSCVAEHEGMIVGFMVGALQDWPFLDWVVATDLVTISERAGAGSMLLSAFEKWAAERGANEVLIGVSYGGRDAAPLFERKGFKHVGGMFSKRIER